MVYFIQDTRTYEIKIGFTDGESSSRLSALQTGNPSPLKLIFEYPGNKSCESELHRMFDHLRTHGEWFMPGAELLIYLVNLAAEYSNKNRHIHFAEGYHVGVGETLGIGDRYKITEEFPLDVLSVRG